MINWNNPYIVRGGVVGKKMTSLYTKHIIHGHTIRLII